MDLNEKTLAATQDAKLINLNANIIYPKLDEMMNARLSLMVGRFNKGEKDFIGDAAYMSALVDIKNALSQKQNMGNKAMAKAIAESESNKE